jgi:hypothetical protein
LAVYWQAFFSPFPICDPTNVSFDPPLAVSSNTS